MLAANDLRAILNAAEEAAARKDPASAERLLREALALQESDASSQHHEVAKTLNNLAIVCEMTGKLADAESCYRRAYAIAMASLPATDPFVTTSRENLEEFCKAQGRQMEAPPAPAPAPAPRPASPAPPRAATPAPQASRVSSPVLAPTARASSRAIMIAVLSLVALAIVIAAARYWPSSGAPPEREASVSQSEPAAAPAPSPIPPVPAVPVSTREPEPVVPAPSPVVPAPGRSRTTAPSSAPTIVSAQVCRSLSVTEGTWRCDSASGVLEPGSIYFYTRVASDRDTVVEHRWYRDDRLHQRVELSIRANQSGFRTYSRTTVSPERAGNWKVEVRDQNGRVLDEETFSVR